jgi:hypothetical protein
MTRIDSPAAAAPPSRRAIVMAVAGSFVIALIVLVTAVLPAEYSIDPLGTGRALGLTALGEGGSGAVTPQDVPFRRDQVEFVLGPYETVEYTYRMERDAAMVFSWEATRPILYDFHGQPDGAPADYAESFDRQERDRANGTFTAPFSGTQGWYFENGGRGEVTIRLNTAGYMSDAREFFDGRVFPRPLLDHEGAPITDR